MGDRTLVAYLLSVSYGKLTTDGFMHIKWTLIANPSFTGVLEQFLWKRSKEAKDSKESGGESSDEEDDGDVVQVDGNIDIDWESIKMELHGGKLSYFLDSTPASAATVPVILNTETELGEVEEMGEVAFAAKLKINKRFCPNGQNLRVLMLNGKDFPQEEGRSDDSNTS